MKPLKSNSVPASLYGSTPLTRKESIKVQNDRLVSSLLRKYSDRKKEIKDARKHWKRWEDEKIEIQKRKIQRQKVIHVCF